MHLTEPEVSRFYQIWFPLLHFVNERHQVVSDFPNVWQPDHGVPVEDAVAIRNVLWTQDALRTAFITENPAHLSPADLAVVASWSERVAGNFFVWQHLKKYSVLISSETPAQAYGVVGLVSPLAELVGSVLPIYVQAVLLPFEGRIIYDSVLSAYPLHFGGGYRRSLATTYRDLQEQGRFFTTLPTPLATACQPVNHRKVLLAFQRALRQSGLSASKVQEHSATLQQFAETFLDQKTPPSNLLHFSVHDIEAYRATAGKVNLVSFKRFVWFLRDTGRMDWSEIERLLDFLKQVR